MEINFKDKVVLVTGAAGGIGYTTAKMFVESGAKVIITDINKELLEQSAKELNTDYFVCDVSKESEVKNVIENIVLNFGKLDCAYNNVGIQVPVAEISEADGAEFDRAISVNLKGMWNCLKYEMKQMKAQTQGGAIVNCSSQCGLLAQNGLGAYTASKHGVLGLTKVAALEGAKYKIRVNAICPGATDTPMVRQAIKDYPEHMKNVIDGIPLKRIADSTEIASAVLYLCHEQAGFITGEIMAVDGGCSLV